MLLIVSAFLLVSSVFAADDVLVFTDSDFATKVAQHDTILVEFYAPWCGHCKKLAPEYEKAATLLKKSDPPVSLAKVDCTVETDTCSKHGVSGYPTLKIFKGGEFAKDYNGPREAAGIVKTMNKEAGPVAKNLESVGDAKKFVDKETVGVIGFFDDADSSVYKDFMKVANQVETVRFAYTMDKDIKKEFKQDEEGVVVYRPKVLQSKFEDAESRFSGKTFKEMKTFVESESLGLCAERTQDNAKDFGKPLIVAYFNVDYVKNPKGTNYWRNRVMKVGKKLRDEGNAVFFGISGIDEMGRELEECGLTAGDAKTPVVCGWDAKNRKFKMDEEFSVESFEEYARAFLDGKLEPYLKSEPVPESNDEPVKVVVAKNFDEIVNDENKNVLIEFYAPWCGHCKSLAPKYDELAAKLIDEESVTIAKMDATANDVPSPYEVRGFPTIYFSPAGSKDSPKKYEGGREVEDFIKYLSKQVKGGLKTVGKDSKKKKKSKTEL